MPDHWRSRLVQGYLYDLSLIFTTKSQTGHTSCRSTLSMTTVRGNAIRNATIREKLKLVSEQRAEDGRLLTGGIDVQHNCGRARSFHLDACGEHHERPLFVSRLERWHCASHLSTVQRSVAMTVRLGPKCGPLIVTGSRRTVDLQEVSCFHRRMERQ